MSAQGHGQDGSDSSGKVAALGPYLLARKGGARPAMRQPHAANSGPEDDLGWNDTGEDAPPAPEVLRQQDRLRHHVADGNARASQQLESAAGRRAAFTLRLDEERHFKLRLASTVAGESAQTLVTRALDDFLARNPQIEHLASRIRGGPTSKA